MQMDPHMKTRNGTRNTYNDSINRKTEKEKTAENVGTFFNQFNK